MLAAHCAGAALWQADASSTPASESRELMLLFEDADQNGSVMPSDSRHDPTCASALPLLVGPLTLPRHLSPTVAHAFSRTASPASALARERSTPVPRLRCKISHEDATTIFLAARGRQHEPQNGLSSRLADEYGITAKAVRDIWNLRTWRHATKLHWGPKEFKHCQDKQNRRGQRHQVGHAASQDQAHNDIPCRIMSTPTSSHWGRFEGGERSSSWVLKIPDLWLKS